MKAIEQRRECCSNWRTPLRKLFALDLDDRFSSIDRTISHIPVVGLYANELEPSSQLTVVFEDDQDWNRHEVWVKTRMIEFAQTFNQSNIHLIDAYAKKPDGVGYGQVVGDTSYQKKFWAQLRFENMHSFETFENFRVVQEIALECNISHLTADYTGGLGFLIYSMSGFPISDFEENTQKLEQALRERALIERVNRREDVALVNFGEKTYGASHTYAEALDYLATRFSR